MTLDELEAVVPAGPDVIFRLDSAFTMGFMKPFPILPLGRPIAHTGTPGSVARSALRTLTLAWGMRTP